MADFSNPRVSEKRFYAIAPQAFTADGTADGTVTVESTYCWKVGQIVTIVSNTVPPERFKIKAVLSDTVIKVGPIDKPIHKFSNISALTVADNAMIELVDDAINNGSQASNRRPVIDLHEIVRQTYEEEPTVAFRTHNVDWLGRSYSEENPLPVSIEDIDITVEEANISVQLTRKDDDPKPGDLHDSTRIGNQDYEVSLTPNDDESKAGFDVMMLNRLIDVPHDDIEVTQFTTDGDPEIIEVREGGNTKLTLTLSYNADGDFQRVQRS